MRWEERFQKDVIEWDVPNWSRAVDFWPLDEFAGKSLRVLELGARRGGLSLLFAKKGLADDGNIICSDLSGPSAEACVLHKKYHVENHISYAAVDAVKLDEQDAYDIICFKSVLGGIGHNDNKQAQKTAIHNCWRALKPGGYLLFAENLTSTRVHQALRRKFNAWGTSWRYITIDEALHFCQEFSRISYRCFGFFGTLGRNEGQRCVLGQVDRIFDRFLPERAKYIISVSAQK